MTERPAHSALKVIRLVLWAMVAVAAIGLAVLLLGPRNRAPSSGPAITNLEQQPKTDYAASIGGPFTLTASDGKPFTQADLRGTPSAVFFGFTRCPDVCPTTLANLARWRKQMGADGDRFRIVFVSLDSGHDSPAEVGRYAEMFGTPIVALAGSQSQVDGVAKAFDLHVEKVPQDGGDYTIDHTATVFLLDKEGRLQSTIAMAEGDSGALAKLRRLVA